MEILRFALSGDSQLLDSWVVDHCALWFGEGDWALAPLTLRHDAAFQQYWIRCAGVGSRQVVIIAVVDEISALEAAGLIVSTLGYRRRVEPSVATPQVLLLLGHPVQGLTESLELLLEHGILVRRIEVRLAQTTGDDLLVLNTAARGSATSVARLEMGEELEVFGDPLRAVAAHDVRSLSRDD